MIRGDVGVSHRCYIGGITEVILPHNPAFLRTEALLLGKVHRVENVELAELFPHALPVALEDGAVDLGSLLRHSAMRFRRSILPRILPYHRIVSAADPVGVVNDEGEKLEDHWISLAIGVGDHTLGEVLSGRVHPRPAEGGELIHSAADLRPPAQEAPGGEIHRPTVYHLVDDGVGGLIEGAKENSEAHVVDAAVWRGYESVLGEVFGRADTENLPAILFHIIPLRPGDEAKDALGIVLDSDDVGLHVAIAVKVHPTMLLETSEGR